MFPPTAWNAFYIPAAGGKILSTLSRRQQPPTRRHGSIRKAIVTLRSKRQSFDGSFGDHFVAVNDNWAQRQLARGSEDQLILGIVIANEPEIEKRHFHRKGKGAGRQ